MSATYSKSILKAYVEAFIQHSRSLRYWSFNRTQIAAEVFPTQAPQNAKSHFSAACSTANPRPLTAHEIKATLATCRKLLLDQLRRLDAEHPERIVDDFERQLCRQLRFRSPLRAGVDDFLWDDRLADAKTPAEFGLPDIAKWESYPFDFSQVVAARSYSIELLEEITAHLAAADDAEDRISLLHTAICAAALHYPGSPHHERALNLSLEAADLAKLSLLRKSYQSSDEHRLQATDLGFQLNYLAFRPLLDSPVNYLTAALQNRRLPATQWQRIHGFLNEAVMLSEQLVEIDPQLTRSWVHVSSVLSMKARMLLAAGGVSAVREADALHRRSVQVLDRLQRPYGMAYPILKDIILSKRKSALRRCQQTIEANEQAGIHHAAAAFSALFLQLTHAEDTQATTDSHLRDMARRAVESPEIRYSLSHVFDARAVERILKLPQRNSHGQQGRASR